MLIIKKVSALLLVLAMALCFFACGNKDDKKETDGGAVANTAENTEAADDFGSNGAAQAVKSYFKSIENTDTGAFIALMPAFDRSLYSSDTEADFENEIKDLLGVKLEHYEAKCGSNTAFEIKVTAVNDVSEKVLNSMKELYAEDENLSGTEIGEGSEIEFEIAVKGSNGDIAGNGVAHVIQENGEWKIHNMNLDI